MEGGPVFLSCNKSGGRTPRVGTAAQGSQATVLWLVTRWLLELQPSHVHFKHEKGRKRTLIKNEPL